MGTLDELERRKEEVTREMIAVSDEMKRLRSEGKRDEASRLYRENIRSLWTKRNAIDAQIMAIKPRDLKAEALVRRLAEAMRHPNFPKKLYD